MAKSKKRKRPAGRGGIVIKNRRIIAPASATASERREFYARAKGYDSYYAERLSKKLRSGGTVQEARGHKGGDRGKVATRERGTKAIATQRTRKFKIDDEARELEEFTFTGKRESSVLTRIRVYATIELEIQGRRRKANRKGLIYRFIYRDIAYADDPDRRDDWATATGGGSSHFYFYHDWETFMLDYEAIKNRSVDAKVGAVLIGYSG